MEKLFKNVMIVNSLYSVVAFLISLAIVGVVVLVAWNYTLPHLFNLPKINYLEAVLLFILSKTLFFGFASFVKE